MAKNFDKAPMLDKEFKERRAKAFEENETSPVKHGLTRFRALDWKDESQITEFMLSSVKEEEQERLKSYLYTLASDESLDLTNFEIKRIAVAMLALDRGDAWFFKNASEGQWQELSIELQKFLAGKEAMVMDILRKSKTAERKPKNLWDQLDGEFKNWELKADGEVEGVTYEFEAKKKKKKVKMLEVTVDGDNNGSESSGSGDSEEEDEDN